MKKWAVLSGILLPLCVAGTALTMESPAKKAYVSLKIGGTIPKDLREDNVSLSFDKGANVSATVGLHLQSSVRLELEGSYRKVDMDKISVSGVAINVPGEMEVKALMANLYYDFPVESVLRPYLMGGIGRARMEMTGLTSYKDTGGAYQLGGGLSYALNDAVTADVGYRYLGVRKEGGDLGLHELLAGLRFGF